VTLDVLFCTKTTTRNDPVPEQGWIFMNIGLKLRLCALTR